MISQASGSGNRSGAMGNTGAAVAQTAALPDCYEVGALQQMGIIQRSHVQKLFARSTGI